MKSISIVFFLLLIVCISTFSSDMERNLLLSGSNRPELEKVLKYYGQDKKTELKLRAAQFLIENMDAHFIYQSKGFNTYYKTVDSIFSLNRVDQSISKKQDSLFEALPKPNFEELYSISDLQTVTADFLINNIDEAFTAWKSPWAKNLNFEDFCDYILPYKASDERPTSWRKAFRDSITPYVKNLIDINSCNNNLLAYFPFEKTIKDASGMKQQVVKNGNTLFSKGINGSSLLFDGKKNSLNLSFRDTTVVNKEITIALWVFQEEAKTSANLFDIYRDTSAYLKLSPCSQKGLVRFAAKKTGRKELTLDAPSIPINKWTHITLTLSGKIATIYINGKQVSKATLSYTPTLLNLFKKLYIGRSNDANTPFFHGKMDEFRIYNRILFESEIKELAESETNKVNTHLSRLQETAWAISNHYKVKIMYSTFFLSGYAPSLLMKIKRGTCYDYSILGTLYYRSLGIPAAIDYTPQWANRSMSHSWSVFLDNGKLLDFSFSATNDTLGGHLKRYYTNEGNIAPKVFREMFSKQPTSLGMIKGNEEVPVKLERSALKDVTDAYMKTSDLTIPLETPTNRQFAYLCCFNNRDWVPVHWGKIEKQKTLTTMKFSKMGRGVAYLPAIYKSGETTPAAYPFILTDSGTMKSCKPDLKHKQTMCLTRKYMDRRVRDFGKTMLKGKFQVANKEDFSDSVTVYTIQTMPEIRYNHVSLSLDKPYRFFRFYFLPGTDIAELEIYSKDSSAKLTGKTIGYPQSKISGYKTLMDGNALSYYWHNSKTDGWVGLDFGTPTDIKTFRFLPRNDDNFIREKEVYELFYWDKKWVSLGVKTGDKEQMLTYDNAPTNALFLLHHKTKGTEERIFTYEKGGQVWW